MVSKGSDFPGSLDGLLLRPVHGASAPAACSANGPPAVVGDHMLVASGHRNLLCLDNLGSSLAADTH